MILSIDDKMILAYALSQELMLPDLEELLAEQFYKTADEQMYISLNMPNQIAACIDDLPNNGKAHTHNPAWIDHDNFKFRHQSECYFYQSYKNLHIPITPLSVWGHKTKQGISVRREPDLISIHQGQFVLLEIDGPSHYGKTRADESERCSMFLDAGANIIHIIHHGYWDMQWANLRRDICLSLSSFIKHNGLTSAEFYLDFKIEHLLHEYNPLPFIYDDDREELNEPTKVYIPRH